MNDRDFDVVITQIIYEPLGQPDAPKELCWFVKMEVTFTLPNGTKQTRVEVGFIVDTPDLCTDTFCEQVMIMARNYVDAQRRRAKLTQLTGSRLVGRSVE